MLNHHINNSKVRKQDNNSHHMIKWHQLGCIQRTLVLVGVELAGKVLWTFTTAIGKASRHDRDCAVP